MRPDEHAGASTILRRAGTAVRLAWEAAPRPLVAVLALTIVNGALPVAAAWATKVLLDELVRGHDAAGSTIAACVAVLAAAGVTAAVVGTVETYLQTVMRRAIGALVQVRVFRRINRHVGIGAFEDPAVLDRIRLAEQSGDSAPEEAVGGGIHLVQAGITAAGFIATLLVLWPPMVAIVALAAAVAASQQLWLGRMRAAIAT